MILHQESNVSYVDLKNENNPQKKSNIKPIARRSSWI